MDYVALQVGCDKARSHGWWRNLVEHGPWEGPNGVNVGPPPPKTWAGIAKLFQTTTDQVRQMIASDWFGVNPNQLSPMVMQLAPLVDQLTPSDQRWLHWMAYRMLNGPEEFRQNPGAA